MKHNPAVMEPLCSKFLLRKEKGWQTPAGTGLPTTE